ncbi:MAG: tautomerase family protein [Chloroflexota bacterium]|nr:tautomerase family protein [Chloroflexota bacterium]
MSDTIHSCLVDALGLPESKRFHRFFPMDSDDFIYPADRSEDYTIIEISMFSGRSTETKKRLIRLLFARIEATVEIDPQDVEITIFEAPASDWGIRGRCGDELALNYDVEV